MQIEFGAAIFFYKLDARTVFPLVENGHRSRLNGSAGTSLRAACPLGYMLLPLLLIVRDTRLFLVSLRPCCYDASITVTIDVTGGDGDEWWEAGQNCLLRRYEASGGVWRSRLAKEGGLNEEEEDNWIRLQGRGQRGGVGGYLILAIGV
eukprot:scaffold220050_cov55-Attheya_sp.AAC.3